MQAYFLLQDTGESHRKGGGEREINMVSRCVCESGFACVKIKVSGDNVNLITLRKKALSKCTRPEQ